MVWGWLRPPIAKDCSYVGHVILSHYISFLQMSLSCTDLTRHLCKRAGSPIGMPPIKLVPAAVGLTGVSPSAGPVPNDTSLLPASAPAVAATGSEPAQLGGPSLIDPLMYGKPEEVLMRMRKDLSPPPKINIVYLCCHSSFLNAPAPIEMPAPSYPTCWLHFV